MLRATLSMLQRIALTVVAALPIIAQQPASAQQPIVLKIGSQTLNDVTHEYMKTLKVELEKASGNRIRVDVFPAGQVGNFQRMMEGTRLGNLQAVAAPFEFFVGVDARFQAPAMTGLFKSNEHASRFWDHEEARKLIADLADEKGLQVGAIVIVGSQMFTFRTPATRLADFAKRRIRVLASEVEQATVQSLGASTIPMTLPEVAPALQQGMIDGASGAIGIFTPLRYYDTAPNAIDTRLSTYASLVLFSKTWLKDQPADIQKIIAETARKIEPDMFKWMTAKTSSDIDVWQKNNGKIVLLPPDEQAEAERRVHAATQTVLAKYPKVAETYAKLKSIAAATP